LPWGGVLLGIAALAAGAGPRTASNDLYHRMMLILIGIVILILSFGRRRLTQSDDRAATKMRTEL
jgi:uncharacterized membrane protein